MATTPRRGRLSTVPDSAEEAIERDAETVQDKLEDLASEAEALAESVAAHPINRARGQTVPSPKRAALTDDDEVVRAMWYSDPGRGKTTAMATLARRGRVVFIDAEKRLHPRALRRQNIPIENLEVYPAKDTDEQVTFDGLMELANEIRERLDDGEEIVGVCFDSVTEIYAKLLEDAVGREVAQLTAMGKYRHPYRRYQDNYGDMSEEMRRVIRAYRDLEIPLGFSALVRRDEDEAHNVRVSGAMTPAVYKDLSGYVDVILYCQFAEIAGEEEYSALTRPAGPFDAKDAFGVLPPLFVDPTFDRLIDYVEGKLTRGDGDPVQVAAKQRRQREQAEAAEAKGK